MFIRMHRVRSIVTGETQHFPAVADRAEFWSTDITIECGGETLTLELFSNDGPLNLPTSNDISNKGD